jgi:DNA-binding MarR family transcriptional regulator
MNAVAPDDPAEQRTDAAAVDPERRASVELVWRAFKGSLAGLRRMRSRETRGPGELSDAQYSVLFCLRDAEALSAGDIALAADLSPASATEMLEGLALAGLVRRERSQRDRRVVLTSLTEHGRKLTEQRRARFEPRLMAALEAFSNEELDTAARVLGSVRAMFDRLADEREQR